jgi:hypothetical protein
MMMMIRNTKRDDTVHILILLVNITNTERDVTVHILIRLKNKTTAPSLNSDIKVTFFFENAASIFKRKTDKQSSAS